MAVTRFHVFLFAMVIAFLPLRGRADYSKLEYSHDISKQKFQQALQAMVNAAYMIGFRTLGSSEDAFHCHLLFDGNNQNPSYLLFHTQERADLYNRYEPKSPFNYVDITKRNWLVNLTNLKVEDATHYRFDYTTPQWCLSEEVHTINYDMLDPQKLGFSANVREHGQINFYKTKCNKKVDDPGSTKISVVMPDGKTMCLELYYDVPRDKYYSPKFFEYGSQLARDRASGKVHSLCPDSSASSSKASAAPKPVGGVGQ